MGAADSEKEALEVRAMLDELAARHGAAAVHHALVAYLQEALDSDHHGRAIVEELSRQRSAASAMQDALAIVHDADHAARQLRASALHIRDMFRAFLSRIDNGSPELARIAARLLEATNDIEDVSEGMAKLTHAARYVDARRIDPGPCRIRDVLELAVRTFARQTSIPIELDRTPDVIVRASPTDLNRVLLNLLRNAAEAIAARGSGGGHIRVKSWSSSTMAFVVVEDDGIGFCSAESERLLRPFVTAKAEGMGLGLAVVQKLVRRWGGTLQIDSEPNCGSRFTFGIPTL